MAAPMDIRARIKKTGQERIYPEKVFEVACDDPDNPLEFIEYVEIPKEEQSQATVATVQSPLIHQQLLIDELIKTRQEKLALEQQIKSLIENNSGESQEKKHVGRPKKEIVA